MEKPLEGPAEEIKLNGKIIPADLIAAEVKARNFPDVNKQMEWSTDSEIVYSFPNKGEALIQIAGNWRLIKWRKTSEIYDCLQCHT